MSRRVLEAGPAQMIAVVPDHLELEVQADNVAHGVFFCDGMLGRWAFGDNDDVHGPAATGECPLCFGVLTKPRTRPMGRMTYRLTRAVAEPGTREFMMDLLPDHLEFVACAACQVGFTRPYALLGGVPHAMAPL